MLDEVILTAAKGTHVLEAGDVTLVPAVPRDIAVMAATCGDRTARRMLEHWAPGLVAGSAGERRQILTRRLFGFSNDKTTWLVYARVGRAAQHPRHGRVVGVRFVERRRTSQRSAGTAHCGGWIAERWRRHGFGSAALSAALAYAYGDPRTTEVRTGTRPDNRAAQANMARCGFVPDGRSTEADVALDLWVHRRGGPTPDLVVRTTI